MKLDISKVEFSKYDLRESVKIPGILDSKLAYFCGVHFGDGNLGNYKKYYYSLEYAGHLVDECEFYTKYFRELFSNLFNKELRVYKTYRKTGNFLKLSTQSKAIFTFLKNSIGLPVGQKLNKPFPHIIIQSKFSKDFIRGLADADFSLSFKKRDKNLHYYPTISLKSNSKTMVLQTNNLLRQWGFKTYILFDSPSKRYDKIYISHSIDLNGEEQLELWMKKIGFNSRKHLTKYFI